MPLRRISKQGREDLYQTFGHNPSDHGTIWIEANRMMLELLPALEELCAPLVVWALTSHRRLVLLTHDDYTTPWYVMIDALPVAPRRYRVRYLMSEEDAHWPNAIVEAMAASVGDACRLILLSMQRTRAWKGLSKPASVKRG